MQGSQAREPENTDPPRRIELMETTDGRRGVVSTERSETIHCLNLNQWNPVAGKRNKLPPSV